MPALPLPLPLTTTLNRALGADAVAALAAEEVWTAVYAEVRAMAATAIAREAAGHACNADLHPTVLVQEIFVRVHSHPPGAWESRRHFFGAIARACEQALVDLARSRKAIKRGGGKPPLPLTFVASELSSPDHYRVAADYGLPAALERLNAEYPRAAEVARLRSMLGLSNIDAAKVLGVSDSTTEKDWTFARAWLRRALDREVAREV